LGDAWRVSAVAGAAEVFYDLYLDDRALPIAQSGWLGRVEAQRRIADGGYLGLRLRYLSVDTRVRFSTLGAGLIPDLGAEVTAGLAGPTLEADFRDDDIAPRAGWRMQAVALQSFDEPFEDFGAGDYQSATVLFDHFTPLFTGDALAIRLAACGVTGDAPFFELCSLGGDDGFRGYASGRYLGRRLLSAQAEYRGRFSERWGWVAFGGVGGVGDALGEDDVIKPAGGVGLRYRLSRDFGLDFSADIAVGDEGAAGYVYLGQAF
jgi:outer membrane translocation and assembly module TamA